MRWFSRSRPSFEEVVETAVYAFAQLHGLNALEREWARLHIVDVVKRLYA